MHAGAMVNPTVAFPRLRRTTRFAEVTHFPTLPGQVFLWFALRHSGASLPLTHVEENRNHAATYGGNLPLLAHPHAHFNVVSGSSVVQRIGHPEGLRIGDAGSSPAGTSTRRI